MSQTTIYMDVVDEFFDMFQTHLVDVGEEAKLVLRDANNLPREHYTVLETMLSEDAEERGFHSGARKRYEDFTLKLHLHAQHPDVEKCRVRLKEMLRVLDRFVNDAGGDHPIFAVQDGRVKHMAGSPKGDAVAAVGTNMNVAYAFYDVYFQSTVN